MQNKLKIPYVSTFLISICCWILFFLFVFLTNPQMGGLSIFGFYISLFLAIVFSLFWVETSIRLKIWVMPKPLLSKVALRHGLIVALASVVILAFQSHGFLNLWMSVGIVALAVAMEIVFNL